MEIGLNIVYSMVFERLEKWCTSYFEILSNQGLFEFAELVGQKTQLGW